MPVDELLRKLKPVLGEEKTERIWRNYISVDNGLKQLIETDLRLKLAKTLEESFESRQRLLEPPPEALAYGEYQLGEVYYGKTPVCPFGFREDEFIQHIAIFGRSGSGKTNIAFLLLRELLRHKKPFLVFDWKRNYKDLLSLPEFKGRIKTYTLGRDASPFHWNPLIPPSGTDPAVWLKKLIEVMGHAYFLGEGVAFMLQECIDACYRECGVYEGNSIRYPDLADVSERLWATKVKGRQADWMESALRAVGTIGFARMGTVVNRLLSFPLEKLLRENVILELEFLTESDKTFFIEAMLLWIHHYRLGLEEERERFCHAIVIEEAHHILTSKKQELRGTESVTDVILREIREMGESVILLDQEPSLISRPALANTYCTIALNTKDGKDVATLKRAMLLEAEEAAHIGRLPVGEGIVKLQDRWTKPFLVRFPHLSVPKGLVSEREIKERFGREYTENGWRFAAEFLGKCADGVCRQEVAGGDSGVISGGEDSSGGNEGKRGDIPAVVGGGKVVNRRGEEDLCAIGLTTKEETLLKDIARQEFIGIAERYMNLGLGVREGNGLRDSLARKDLVSIRDVSLWPLRNARIKLLELTERGRACAGAPMPHDREGGLVHRFWVDTLARLLQSQGFGVKKEYPVGEGQTVDLLAEREGGEIAVEVETGNSDALSNMGKCLRAGFRRVWILALDRTERVRLEQEVAAKGLTGMVTVLTDITTALRQEGVRPESEPPKGGQES